MTADARGFAYPFKSLLRLEEWRLAALEGEVAGTAGAVLQACATRDACREALRQASVDACVSGRGPLDPSACVRRLHWLSDRRSLVNAAEQELEEAKNAHAAVLKRHAAATAALRAIEAHRDAAWCRHVRATQARELAAADADWLVRSANRDPQERPA